MDKIDHTLIALLRRNSRESIANLAHALNVTRATVRKRLENLQTNGTITGFTVRLRQDDLAHPVRGITLIKIAGHRTERIIRQLHHIPAIQAIHATNGKWDVIAELATNDLVGFDLALSAMRKIDGISESETNLLLATHPYGKGKGSFDKRAGL